MIVDEDFVLYESVAIIEYLDERYPAGRGRVFPPDVKATAGPGDRPILASLMGPEDLLQAKEECDTALISEGRVSSRQSASNKKLAAITL